MNNYASSYISDKHSLTTLTAGGNAALIGSQLKGKRVELNSENLTIESLQEKASYKGKQMQVSGQVTVGYGFAMGGNYSRSKVSSDYASVREQAGIFAGEGGYHVNVNKHTNLIGGVITSSAQVESEGKNRFETDTLAYSDIQNHANYQGSAIGLGGSIAMNFDTPFGEHGQAQSKPSMNKARSCILIVRVDVRTLMLDKGGNVHYKNGNNELGIVHSVKKTPWETR
ncbi:hemagglutinin repeat-containing protein [Avibacterium avium]|uniref:hemagglutinin repeat-containing protein n=1 Tax=Avibacterium avium TaxID=751 RepID=UPI003BF90999